MSWTASTGTPTGYDVQHCTGSNCGESGSDWTDFTPGTALTGSSTSTTITELAPSTAYKVRIRAVTAADHSNWVTTSSTTTTIAIVVGFGVAGFSPQELEIRWTALAAATEGYQLQYKVSTGTSWSTAVTKLSLIHI